MSHAMTESPVDPAEPIGTDLISDAPPIAAKPNWGFVILGAAMMLGSLIVSAIVSEPSQSLQFGNRAFMAIGGGLAAGGILGYLNVNVPFMNNRAIRGSGGFGVFLVLYFFNPPQEVAYAIVPEAKKQQVANVMRSTVADSAAERRDVRAALNELGFKGVKDFTIRASDDDLRKFENALKRHLESRTQADTQLSPATNLNTDLRPAGPLVDGAITPLRDDP